jgi:hypothetical protein
MNHELFPDITVTDHEVSRRGVLRVGGLSIALAALVAACGNDTTDKKPARVGQAPTPPTLPEGVVNDGVLFRTATSIHSSIIDGHKIAKELGKLSASQTAIVDAYTAAHMASIKDLQQWTTTAGGKPWTCANARFDRVILTPIHDRITGRPKQGSEETDVPPSDDPNRDAMALVHALEDLAAAMHQSLVPQFSQPKYRAATMVHGVAAARRAAALALVINPDNVVNPTTLLNANLDATTTTEAATTTTQNIAQASGGAATTTTAAATGQIQQYYAIPGQFGILSAVQLAVGAFSSGTQFTINIETPSLNSFVYDYQTDC